MGLKRKQIYLDPENDRRIKKLARATGLTEAEHIRRAIASYVAQVPDLDDATHPLTRMIGICDSPSGPRDTAVQHDRYLYGKRR